MRKPSMGLMVLPVVGPVAFAVRTREPRWDAKRGCWEVEHSFRVAQIPTGRVLFWAQLGLPGRKWRRRNMWCGGGEVDY